MLKFIQNAMTTKMWYVFIFYISMGQQWNSLLLEASTGLLCQPWKIYGEDCGAISGMKEWQEKRRHLENTWPSVTVHRFHTT
jgi:hypothetical protein